MAVNWSLGLPQSNPLDLMQQGFQQGRQMREGLETRNALAAYAQNPNDPATLAKLIPFNPELAMKLQGEQKQHQRDTQLRDVRTRVAGGDKAAVSELAGLDWDSWMKLDERTRQQATQRIQTIGQAALWADTPEKWDQAIDQLAPQYPELMQLKGHFSPQVRAKAVAEAGKMMDLLKQANPDWHFSPNGGLVDFNSPESIQQYGQWMGGQPPPAQAAPAPPPGFVIDNGGPTPQASGGFP